MGESEWWLTYITKHAMQYAPRVVIFYDPMSDPVYKHTTANSFRGRAS